MARPLNCFVVSALAVALLLAAAPARAQQGEAPPAEANECNLTAALSGDVVNVTGGDRMILADGAEVLLAGILAPSLQPGGGRARDPQAAVIAEAARGALQAMVLRRTVRLFHGAAATDRHGRLLAHVFAGKGGKRVWVQRELVARGLARVASFAHTRACVAGLLAAEEKARKARIGLWALRGFAVRKATDAGALFRLAGSFQLVEGRIASASAAGKRVYLNFGEDYRRDFTVSIVRASVPLFKDAGVDLLALKGKRVRVRGWVELINGPAIAATHPEQLEFLEGP